MSTPDDRTLDPASVASASFSTARRGFEPNEVRAYLHRLSSQLQALTDREAAVQRELDELKAAPSHTGQLDEATVAAWLGQEATAVLTAAREAATQLRGKAQDQADQLLHDARIEAERVRSEALAEATALRDEVAGEVARRRQESMSEAEAEIEGARQEGRSMVSEARAVRERMLADLSRRRDGARTQLSALRGERDRIVNAIEATRDHLDRLMDDLRAASPEDERDVGPVYEQDARGEPRLTLVRPLHPVHQDLPGENPLDAGETTSILAGELDPDDLGALDLEADREGGDVVVELDETVAEHEHVDAEKGEAEAFTDQGAAEPDAGSDPDLERDLAAVIDLDEPDAFDESDDDKKSVDDLFARIRGERTNEVDDVTAEVEVTEAESGAAELDPEAALVAERDAAIGPYHAALARQLKRALADEQNEVFDRLRRASRVSSAADVLGDERDHAERYRAAGEDSVWGAALAGARSTASGDDAADGGLEGALERHRVLDEVLDEVTREVARPVRAHLEAALAGADGDPEEATALLRNAYREWKSQRLDELAAELVHSAYGRGAYAGVAPGTAVVWVVDVAAPRCPDGEMNAAAGAIAAGEAFPSGHRHPPAYAGCRCLLAVTHG